jgi:hypothetical protein
MRDPPLSDEAAELAAFQLKSFIFGHGEQARLLGDPTAARRLTRAAFEGLLARCAG